MSEAAAKYPNLKPWPKGKSGNPGGKPKALLTKDDVERVFQSMSMYTTERLQEILASPTTALEAAAARTWLNATITGDMSEIRRILDTSVGKLKEIVEQEVTQRSENKELLDSIPIKDLVKMVVK